jgi:hypothetical protein
VLSRSQHYSGWRSPTLDPALFAADLLWVGAFFDALGVLSGAPRADGVGIVAAAGSLSASSWVSRSLA